MTSWESWTGPAQTLESPRRPAGVVPFNETRCARRCGEDIVDRRALEPARTVASAADVYAIALQA